MCWRQERTCYLGQTQGLRQVLSLGLTSVWHLLGTSLSVAQRPTEPRKSSGGPGQAAACSPMLDPAALALASDSFRHNPGSSLAVSLGRLSAVQTMDNRFQGPPNQTFLGHRRCCVYTPRDGTSFAHSSPISLPSANVWTLSSPCRCVVNHCQFKYTIFLDLNPHLPALHTSPFQVPVEAKSPEQQQLPNTLEHSATAGQTTNNTR